MEEEASSIRWVQENLFSSLGIDGDFSGLGIALSSWDLGGDSKAAPAGDDAVGLNEGEDIEAEVDAEIMLDEAGADKLPDSPVSRPNSPKRRRVNSANHPRKKRKTLIVDDAAVEMPPRTILDIMPSFAPNKVLNFTQMLRYKVERRPRTRYLPMGSPEEGMDPVPAPKRPIIPTPPRIINLKEVAGDFANTNGDPPTSNMDELTALMRDSTLGRAIKKQSRHIKGPDVEFLNNARNYDMVNLSDWEGVIIYEPSMAINHGASVNTQQPINAALESGDWQYSIIWDRETPFLDFTQLQLDEDDAADDEAAAAVAAAEMLKEKEDNRASKRKKRRPDTAQAPGSGSINTGAVTAIDRTAQSIHLRRKELLRDKFNLSNDQAYEVARERHRVRQTFGQLLVQHAYPAMKLQLPWYKTRLTKSEARSFHRPALQFPPNFELHFSKVRGAKKKKDKSGRKVSATGGGDPSEALRTTSDISLRETGPFILLEYSEEHPAVLNNFGMGSILVNYYRKLNDDDEHIPNFDLGEPFILEPTDETPFLKFGNVDKGQTIPTLYNNLVRAPLFRHKFPSTDFLVVKSTIAGQTSYYLREIKAIFTVGQTYPVTEVPGPHSRKITATIKYRLQHMSYKLLRKTPDEHISLKSVLRYFPDQNELQMRQRLKEFMEYHRTGPHAGFWRLKNSHEMLPDAKMYELITPEHVVLSESMQVGQRHLLDAGYGKAGAEADEAGEGDNSNLDIEQQLAPWITTKNFIHAMQNKAMVKLHGPGDPTGRGEGFSFIRVSMKEVFVRAGEDAEEAQAEADRLKTGHRYNVQHQQNVYRSEIERIWKAQYRALGNKMPPELSEEEEQEKPPAATDQIKREGSLFDGREGSPMLTDRGGSVIPDDAQSRKKLVIRRQVAGVWQTEVVRDPNVIAAYVKRKKEEELENMDLDQIKPTGDPVKDAAIRARLLEHHAKLQKNQDRRLQRKNAAIVKEGGAPIVLDRVLKPDTSRRCGHCGQVGHMKTNRKCPRWAEFNTPGAVAASPAMSPPPGSAYSGPTIGAGLGMKPAPPAAPIPFRTTSSFAAPTVPSPLATSPPVSGLEDRISSALVASSTAATVASPSGGPATASVVIKPSTTGKPKIKLSLKPPGSAASPPK